MLNLVDEEVPFRYTVETTAFTAIFVPEFELLLLHAVADALLTCQSLLKSNQRILDAELQHRILRLAYPQDKRASLISKFRVIITLLITSKLCLILRSFLQTLATLLMLQRNLAGT